MQAVAQGQPDEAMCRAEEIIERLNRAIACGAVIDPWNILGFDAHFSLFPALENSVHDHRADELVERLSAPDASLAASLPSPLRLALVGSPNSGKTTLFNIVAGAFPPSEGTIRLAGQVLNGTGDTHCKIKVGSNDLPCLSDMFVMGAPAFIRYRPRAGKCST